MYSWNELMEKIYGGEKIDMECKKAKNSIPESVYETYSSFANTKGGTIVLGVDEDKTMHNFRDRFIVVGVKNPEKLREDFWNTINSRKVNANILIDDNVYIVKNKDTELLVIEVPKANYKSRPVYKGENPFKGTFKRNHEGDYHASEDEVKSMIRDQSTDGNDSTILEGFTMDDIDDETLKRYRQMFDNRNIGHVWSSLQDKDFLEMLGGYRRDRRHKTEGITVAGLLMFGKGLAIRDEFSNIFMDYRNETTKYVESRWIDRITYDGTWENNIFNFFIKVVPRIMEDISKPFSLDYIQRIDDTPIHRAIREAFVNMIIHADYKIDSGVLKVVKSDGELEFSNPGNLKLPIEDIYRGGNSKARNPHMQTILRMVGFGDNAGSGFPDILKIWYENGWSEPMLVEDTINNRVTLYLRFNKVENEKCDRISHEDRNPGLVSELGIDYSRDKNINGISNRYVINAKAIMQNILEQYDQVKDNQEKEFDNRLEFSKKIMEALSDNDYKKVKKIVEYLQKNGSVTPREAIQITGKSSSTVRRYLNILTSTGFVNVQGNTNNIRYYISQM